MNALNHAIERTAQSLIIRVLHIFFPGSTNEKLIGFIKNFGYLAAAEIIGSAIGFPVKILVGRFLGPEEYGKYALIINLTQFFIIPMLLGFTTAILQYLPSHPKQKSEIMGIILGCAAVTTSFFSALFLLTHNLWSRVFDVPAELLWWTIAYSVVYSLYYIFEAFQRGAHRFSLLFWITIVNASVLLVAFLVLLFGFHQNTYQTFITANIAAFVVSCVIFALYIVRDRPRFTFDRVLTKKILGYSGLATIGGVTGFLIGNTDRLFLNHYASLYWVGVYAAYTNASTVLIGRFFQLFINVYFPTVAKEADKSTILRVIHRVYRVAVVPVFAVSALSIWGIIWLFGEQFPIRWDFIVLFSVGNCLTILYQLYMWLFNAQGNRGVKTTGRILVFNSVLNIVLYFFLIQWFGIIGALVTNLVISVVFIVYYRRQALRYAANGYFNGTE